VCEPATNRKLLGGAHVEPSRLLSEKANDEIMINYTTAASELMAERARHTMPVFASLVAEFADLPVTPLVKLGLQRAKVDSKEHIWFEVHSIDGDVADCTCINEPWDVPELREGQRGRQSLAALTDWMIICPAGNMTPRSLLGARILRSIPEEAKVELRALKVAESRG
jgi:uncharacterized protein YegJ (DUF2314 family)